MCRMSSPVAAYIPLLTSLILFKGISPELLTRYLERCACSIRHYRESEVIALSGDPLEELLILVDGRLSADFLSIEGRSLKVENLQPPALVGSTVLFAEDNVFPVQLTAVIDSVIIAISKDELLRMVMNDRIILENLLRDSGNRLRFLADKIKFIQFDSIEKKTAGFLIDLNRRGRTAEFSLPYSVQELSELFGVARPSLSRVLGNLESQGIIAKSGKTVRILDSDALSRLLDE